VKTQEVAERDLKSLLGNEVRVRIPFAALDLRADVLRDDDSSDHGSDHGTGEMQERATMPALRVSTGPFAPLTDLGVAYVAMRDYADMSTSTAALGAHAKLCAQRRRAAKLTGIQSAALTRQMVLLYNNGLTLRQIGGMSGMSERAVKARLKSAGYYLVRRFERKS